MSINFHVNLSVNVQDTASAQANFGVPMFVSEHTVTSNRLDGPYSSLAALQDAGFTAAAAPAVNAWAARVFAQNPRTSQVLIGRRLAAEHIRDALDAIEAADPAAWYATNIELNSVDEILAAAAWTETRSKIFIAQSANAAMLAGTASTAQSTTFTVGGTTDGVYSIAVRNAWTNLVVGTASYTASGDTADDIATALRSAWDGVAELAAISAPAAGAGADVDIDFDGLGNSYTFDLTSPGDILTQVTVAPTQNLGALGAALAYDRTAVIYHDDDTEYLDAAWTARCLGFNLDAPAGVGSWSYHRLAGITATRLSDAEKTQLTSHPVNYYAPVKFTSGVEDPGFTFPGQMLSGRFIDVTTTLDVTQARMEEALLGVLTGAAATSRPRVPYTDSGIQRFRESALDVFGRLVRAGHFADQAESSATGRITPYVDAPRASEVSTAEKSARRLTMSSEAVFAGAINSVGDSATVGFTIDLSF